MGGGASAPIAAHVGLGSPTKSRDPAKAMVAFTSLETEMKKPLDATDLCTPRGTAQADLARQEVQRLRYLIKSGSKRVEHATADQRRGSDERHTNMLLYGSDAHPEDDNVGASERVHHIDDFSERRNRKKAMNKKMLKLKMSLKDPARQVMEMMRTTHGLMGIAAVAHAKHIADAASAVTPDAETKQVEKWINVDYTEREVAVLVSDLRGFTSTTRKYGIVHFASIIVRMRQLVLPIFRIYGALNITTEADNFITVFPDPISAVSAAVEMQKILLDYNASLSEERQHYKVRLNGIGVGCGMGVVLDNEGKLHGTPANEAYSIGEDICENGIILVTKLVADRIKAEGSR